MIRLPGLHLGWQGTVAPSASRLAADPESVCAGELDAWLVTDEHAELIRELRALGRRSSRPGSRPRRCCGG